MVKTEEQRARHREYMREYRKTHPEQRTAEGIRRRYQWMTEHRRQRKLVDPGYKLREQQRSMAGRTPASHRAQEAVRRAVRAGKIIKSSSCEECGQSGYIEAAHYDYEDRLRVRWLCRSCHRRWDRPGNGKGGYDEAAGIAWLAIMGDQVKVVLNE